MYNIILIALLTLFVVSRSILIKDLLDDIVHSGRYAAATYQRFEDWTSEYACPACQHDDIRNTELNTTWSTSLPVFSRGYIGIDHKRQHVVVAFRGTTHVMDVLADAQVVQVQWPTSVNGSKVHWGFLAAYMSARNVVQDALDAIAIDREQYQVQFIGHSLGAAQATLAFVDYVERRNGSYQMRPQLTTFGSPRVGNQAFAQYADAMLMAANGKGLRLVHESDIVPHLPRSFLLPFQDYAHSGREVWARDSEKAPASVLVLCQEKGEAEEDPSCSASVSPLRWNIADHMVYPGIRIGIPKFLIQQPELSL
ncbi:hypothetical protein IW140_004210 [Coemansia sp. RSA 1813]|nr:hypothetical protein LPJ74_005562 [Coemansia sp. RSA 1843]KAJ2568039.1 hypothetical protein IW140_004210 [Coemansia sp. RSA 1813]